MAEPEYRVDSFYINVGAGDSSIHLLLQTGGDLPDPPGGSPDPNKPYVLSAVLIDGGHNRSYTWERINPAIERIQSLSYQIPGNILKFDSVVLTHWDQDHYTGLFKLLETRIDAQLKLVPPADVKIDFLKYDPTTGWPLTTFFAPNWKATGHANGASSKLTLVKRPGDTTTEYMAYPVQGAPKGVPFFIIRYTDRSDKKNIRDVRGWDLFRPEPPEVTASTITAPGQLFSSAHKTLQKRPGMFIVGANRLILGTDDPQLALTQVTSRGGRVGVIDKLPTETNQRSIATMIIWPSGRMSAYFAGDLDYKDETGIVKWMGADGTRVTVPTVKASHHGASTSTPTITLTNFKPKNFILSAGVSHGHPREFRPRRFVTRKADC
jgi:hypothetical protein